ncbi:MAG: hypothetical protein ACLT98_10565 [Eggerthellaceae bacterium]
MFPKSFARTNKNGAPIVTVLISAGITQLFLIVSVFSSSTYQFFYACAVPPSHPRFARRPTT